MNIYGDRGNILAVVRRLEWRGYVANVIEYNQGDDFPEDVDIIIGGGGQDSGQLAIHDDLLVISDKIHELARQNAPMLVVCGLYQLFGRQFTTVDGTRLKGIGLFDAETIASKQRMTGNIITESDEFGEMVGFENHSGKTTLGPNAKPLARVRLGAGNNGHDDTEGVRAHNAIGTYLHGSLLPKNPKLADWLIETALKNKFDSPDIDKLDDNTEELARSVALNLTR